MALRNSQGQRKKYLTLELSGVSNLVEDMCAIVSEFQSAKIGDKRMRVIAFVTQKGGSGKTTLAFCCAVAAQEHGAKVLLLDMDAQGTAEAWYQDREVDTPQLARVDAVHLTQALEAAQAQGFDFVLLDTPGRDEPATAAAVRASDFCIIPCRPTPGDMKATPPTMATLKRLGKQGAFVLTQTPARGDRVLEAAAGLSVLGLVSPVRIVHRHAYQDAQGRGQGVTEFGRVARAAEEVRHLWAWVSTQPC